MNMSEFIKHVNSSRATVYKRIKAAGIDLAEIRDEQGNILPEYVQTIADLFSDISAKQDETQPVNTSVNAQNAAVNGFDCDMNNSAIELAILRERLVARDNEIEHLKSELAAAKADASAWAERYDRDHIALLASSQHVSIWSRIFRKKDF